MLVPLVFWLCVRGAHAGPLWDAAIAAQPDPGARDVAARDYFVAELADPGAAEAATGWTLEEPFPIPDHWLFSVAKGRGGNRLRRREAAAAVGARGVYASDAVELRRRAPVPVDVVEREFDIQDPLFKDQWYLHNSVEEGHDMNVLPVWRRNITGRGVTVAIVDDGLDYTHPDFAESFSLEGSWDYNDHANHPTPKLEIDNHGTRCAGEVAAGINNACGIGVAPGAKVAGIRILSGTLLRSDEARALIHRYNVNDIYSCSWGPDDDGMTIDGPPPIVRRAELEGIERGRGGKGSIYVVASGNGDYRGDNCNYDGYTNSIYSITVGAVDRHNAHPYYAESCSANMAVTYSSNYFDKITTSDRLDPANPHEIKCTNRHSGTSAAAPIAAGLFALVLEARPDLTWRDLQYLVRDTAKPFDIVASNPPNPVQAEWQRTADGRKYHNSFGYGLLDADALVRRAESWELVKPQAWHFMPARSEHAALGTVCEVAATVSHLDWADANMDHIEHVRVRVSYEHEHRGVLRFQLVSPAGIVSDLAASRSQDMSPLPVDDWEFMSVVHWGEKAEGVWKLIVYGNEESHGVLKSWQLKFFGQAKDVSKVRRFSEEWDEHEPHAEVVEDAISMGAGPDPEPLANTTTSLAPSGTSSSTRTGASTLTATASGTSTATASGTSTSVDKKPLPTGTEDSEKGGHGHDDDEDSPHHSVLYYIVVSVIGVAVIVLCAAPIILIYLKRQASHGEARMHRINFNDSTLLEDEFELDDFEDEVENSEYPSDGEDGERRGRSPRHDTYRDDGPGERQGLLDRPE